METLEDQSQKSIKERINKEKIIETKVSPFRRTFEIIITIIFNIVILWFLSLLIDAIYKRITGENLFYPWMPFFVTQIMWLGMLAAIMLFLFFFILASVWQFFKSVSYPAKNQKANEPERVTEIELSEYFQLPLAEIQCRQNSDELIVHENINNERIKELRAMHDKKQ